MKIINVQLFHKLFKQCPSSLLRRYPTKGKYDDCQSEDSDLHSRSQVRLKLDYCLTCYILDNILAITFKLGVTVDLWMPYMLMLVSKTLTLMQGYSGSAKAKNQLATAVGLFFLPYLDLDFANVYMACSTCFLCFL